jgi:membrane protein YqaA with SNARE-associated domain
MGACGRLPQCGASARRPIIPGCEHLTFLKLFFAQLAQVLALYGGWGLLGISFLDSSFVALPSANDLLLIHLSSQHPERALLYALASTVGSVLGAYAIYGLARGGAGFLWHRQSSAAMSRAHAWLERNEFVGILVMSLLPPPAPFKAFLIAAGALRVNAARFGVALLVGRGLRFTSEALLGARYGAQAEAFLKEHFVWGSLAVAGLIVALTLFHRRLARRPGEAPATGVPRSSSSDRD